MMKLWLNFRNIFTEDNTVTNAAAGSEMEDYLDYSYSQLISTGVINSEKIDKTDERIC